jgi:hypothetical protein
MADTPTITLPLVHINGTGRAALVAQYTEVAKGLRETIDAMSEAAPHGRDYYPLGDGVYQKAAAEHVDRLRRLLTVQVEISAILRSLIST